MDMLHQGAEICAGILEALALILIVGVLLGASVAALIATLKGQPWAKVSEQYRHHMARGILVGLEPLVGSDIIHTVAIDLTFASVGALAIVVLIRTFLSFSLEVELTGSWPWQRGGERNGAEVQAQDSQVA